MNFITAALQRTYGRAAQDRMTVARLSDLTSIPESTLYAYANGQVRLPAIQVPVVVNAARNYAAVEAICLACGPNGGAFVQNPVGRSIEGALVGACREFGEAVAAVGDHAMLLVCDREIAEAEQALMDLRETVHAQRAAISDGRDGTIAAAFRRARNQGTG